MRLSINPRDDLLAQAPGTLVRRPKQRTKAPRPKVPEANIQAAVEAWLTDRDIFYIHLPEASLRAIFDNAFASVDDKREAADGLKGLPDLLILHKGRYLSLELKRLDGTWSRAQKDVRDTIGTVEARSAADAIALIEEWLDAVGGA